MRQILVGDLLSAARALLAVDPVVREALMQRMLEEADTADRYRRRLGRGHAVFGSGSLMEVALRRQHRAEPFLSDPDYLDCLGIVIRGLIGWRGCDGSHGRRGIFRGRSLSR